jgi:alkylhydroperoxidase family enzyme
MPVSLNPTATPRIPLREPPYPPELRTMGNTAFEALSTLAPRHLRMALAHHPKLANAFQGLAHAVLFETAVSAREREIAIIRTGALTRSEYVWGMHVSIYGEPCRLSEEQVLDLTLQPSWRGLASGLWTDREKVVVRMVDEFHAHATLSDETWAAMAVHWPCEQAIELMFATCFYRLSCCFLNAAAVPLEEGARRFPAGIAQGEVPR